MYPKYDAVIRWNARGTINVDDTGDDFQLFIGKTDFSNYRNPEITSVDLTQMKKAMLDSKPMEKNEFVKKGYDVNNDGKYTLADIIMMNRNIFKTNAS